MPTGSIYAVQEVKMIMVAQFAYPAAEPALESCCMCVGSGVEVYRQESRDSARAACVRTWPQYPFPSPWLVCSIVGGDN